MEGFDFDFLPEGEIVVDNETHDIQSASGNELRIQMAINRLKSISNNWFVDEIGADLEELVGRPCTSEIANYGKLKIIQSLIEDGLWDEKEILVKAEIKENTIIIYTVYLKIYQAETEDTYSYEIVATLDLVKGVFINFGWEPRR
jgi:hypothetical protein